MNARQAYWLWYDFKDIVGSALTRAKQVNNSDQSIDWDRQNMSILTAALSFACSIFETLGEKKHKPHNSVLAHLRNALLHNNGDITKNTGHPYPLKECNAYIANASWNKFINEQYFSIDRGQIKLYSSIFPFIQKLFDSYQTSKERKEGPPKPGQV